MPGGEYIAYSGALANQLALDVIANNVANASTVGFRRDQTQFDTILGGSLPFARAEIGGIDLSPGAMKLTGSTLNAALEADQFFVVSGADGRELFTRRGDFRLDAQGRLALPNGLLAVGSGGALSVPNGVNAELHADGTLFTSEGAAGRLRIVRFENPQALQKVGEGTISAGEEAGMEDVENPEIAVGYVENSNVNLAAEMVAMLQAQRAFEAAIRSMLINDELTEQMIQAQTQ